MVRPLHVHAGTAISARRLPSAPLRAVSLRLHLVVRPTMTLASGRRIREAACRDPATVVRIHRPSPLSPAAHAPGSA